MTPSEALVYLRAQVDEAEKIRARAMPGPWTIAHGNDIDDFPLISVHGQPAVRMFFVYSVWAGESVAYVPESDHATPQAIIHARNTDPWAALKLLAECLDSQHPDPCTMCHTNHGCRTGRALVSAAEALKGGQP